MKRAFTYQDETSNLFWWIDYSGTDFVVNYGKSGTAGCYELREFSSERECLEEALRLMEQKTAQGYREEPDFDFIHHLYFDTEDFRPHPKTSHPHFTSRFTESFYFDCTDEEAPFGSDEGSDTLQALTETLQKNPQINFTRFPQNLVEKRWGMTFLSPFELMNPAELDRLAQGRINGLPGDRVIWQSDQVVLAAALGQVKITGAVDPSLRHLAVCSVQRMQALCDILGLRRMHTLLLMERDLHLC